MIDSYSFGKIVIDGQKYTNDVIIFPDRIKDNWWREEGHILKTGDVERVVEESPDLLIVGTGSNGRLSIPEETREYIKSGGIKLIDKKSGEACELYNKLKDKKEVVAALHLTC